MSAISRRDILRTLATGVAGGTVLQVIPAQAAAFAHALVQSEKAASPTGQYTPKYFSRAQYATLVSLCDSIIPKDDHSAGAVEAGAPEFIDLLTSENDDYALRLGGGLMWLDNYCDEQYGSPYMQCSANLQKQTLDLIAYRANAKKDPTLSQGVAFFAFLRKMTCDGFYTSKIGIDDLQYIGNVPRPNFPGCPPVPEA
jgi:gluconate 2-dehydrogenase gamma chain